MVKQIESRSDPEKGAAQAVQEPCSPAKPILADVLREQMEFLLAHAGHNSPYCEDCLRLQSVIEILMQPFRS
jgi:hypothetical protein